MTATNVCSNYGGKWDSCPFVLIIILVNFVIHFFTLCNDDVIDCII